MVEKIEFNPQELTDEQRAAIAARAEDKEKSQRTEEGFLSAGDVRAEKQADRDLKDEIREEAAKAMRPYRIF